MGRQDFRRNLRRPSGYRTRAFRIGDKQFCRVCGDPLDGFHVIAKCQEKWLEQVDREAKERQKP